MKNLLFFCFIFFGISAAAQGINWKKSSKWKIYEVNDDRGLRYSLDTLESFPFIEMQSDSIQHFLQFAEIWPKEKTSVWMGAYYATCQLDSIFRKVDISFYGGFFYDEESHRYYQLPAHERNNWMDWLNSLKRRVNEK